MIQQVKMRINDTGRMVTWIPSYAAKVGNFIELQSQHWEVIKVYPGIHESGDLKRTWKVGGLQ